MSAIHVQQIKTHLKATFESHIDMSDYANREAADKEPSMVSRALAAFAVLRFRACLTAVVVRGAAALRLRVATMGVAMEGVTAMSVMIEFQN